MSLQSAVWYLPRSQTPRYNAHCGIFLHCTVYSMMHTLQSLTPRRFLIKRISRRNRNRKYFSLFIRGPDWFESWKNEVENLITHINLKAWNSILVYFLAMRGNKILKKVTKKRRDQRNDKSVCYRKSYFSKFLRYIKIERGSVYVV